MMVQKLRDAGATEVIQHGANWSEADTYLRETFIDGISEEHVDSNAEKMAKGKATNTTLTGRVYRSEAPDIALAGGTNGSVKNVYVPPFEHPKIWEGNATLVEELARQLPTRDGNSRNQHYMRAVAPFPADIIICSIGGGGLFNGVIAGLDRHLNSDEKNTNTNISGRRQDVHVIAAETDGADSLAHSLRQGSLQSLSAITSLATHLGALKVSPQAFANALSPPPGIKVTSLVAKDSEAARGVVRLADETRLLVELACGVSVDIGLNKSALKGLGVDINPDTRVVVIVCGGTDVTPEMLCEYRQRLKDGWTEI
jgi:L-serine/L-threonine ammonia-lyase